MLMKFTENILLFPRNTESFSQYANDRSQIVVTYVVLQGGMSCKHFNINNKLSKHHYIINGAKIFTELNNIFMKHTVTV